MERRVTADTTFEEIVQFFPSLIIPLFERGIRSVA
jgi:hypothetical protein